MNEKCKTRRQPDPEWIKLSTNFTYIINECVCVCICNSR